MLPQYVITNSCFFHTQKKAKYVSRVKDFDKERIINRIRLCAEEGEMTAPEISEQLGISIGTVYRYRDEYDIHIPEGKKGRKHNEEEPVVRFETKVAVLANMGQDSQTIARKVEVPHRQRREGSKDQAYPGEE
jgi:hypothetical protein